ncbi:pitrilysin family protein [Pseudomonas sp. P5_152]|uniref:M16 family metallopeptidase n=1 Tax=Pseudomonas sp. P5_152 TaxID=3043442 RepID=UPI002A36D490|nr:pitrilysin family protein [Pseudomonas sp. P5_152]MDX9665766.1 pitrilysin family protein [Pseudomonas sp. P5_152]
MNIYCSALLLLSGLMPMMAFTASASTTHEFSLDNGLKVVVREDHRAPVATSQLWIKVGSSQEPPGQSGLSHALEHMLYQGSSKTCAGEASAILERLGAAENAFTSNDYTAYYQTLAPDHLGVAFELMADLMTTAHLRTESFATEIEVIKQERRERTDDAPQGLAMERLQAIAFPSSAHATPTIGWMHDLQRMSATQLREWYQRWYAPNNATLVIVGDVSLGQIKPLVERYFGDIPRKTLPEVYAPLELAEPGERKITLSQAIHAPQLLMSFNLPSLTTAPDRRTVQALRLLDILLAGSNSARLKKHLQFNEVLFSQISSGYDPFNRGDSLLLLSAQLNSHQQITLDQAQARIWQVIEQLKTTPIDPQELERARTLLIASQVYQQDSITEQATRMGTLESIGLSWRLMEEDIETLNQVSAKDIQQAAVTYLTRQRMSVAHLLPENSHE